MHDFSVKKILFNIQRQMEGMNALLFKRRKEMSRQDHITLQSNGMTFFPDPSKAYSKDSSDIQTVSRSKYQSYVYEYYEKEIDGEFTLMNEKTEGVISEIYLISSNGDVANKAYYIQVLADDNVIYNGSWTHFEGRDSYEDDLWCEDDGANYVLRFSSVFYLNKIEIRIYNSTATFSHIHVKALQKIPKKPKQKT
jgi:hypothetical protein